MKKRGSLDACFSKEYYLNNIDFLAKRVNEGKVKIVSDDPWFIDYTTMQITHFVSGDTEIEISAHSVVMPKCMSLYCFYLLIKNDRMKIVSL